MPPHLRARVEEEIAKQDASRTPSSTATSSRRTCSPYTGKGAKRGPSKLEQRFMHALEAEKAAGWVVAWGYEVMSVRIPGRAHKRPDFFVRVAPSRCGLVHGLSRPLTYPLSIVEVKPVDRKTGRPYYGPKGSHTIRLLAEVMEPLGVGVFVAWPTPNVGGWHVERAEVSS